MKTSPSIPAVAAAVLLSFSICSCQAPFDPAYAEMMAKRNGNRLPPEHQTHPGQYEGGHGSQPQQTRAKPTNDRGAGYSQHENNRLQNELKRRERLAAAGDEESAQWLLENRGMIQMMDVLNDAYQERNRQPYQDRPDNPSGS